MARTPGSKHPDYVFIEWASYAASGRGSRLGRVRLSDSWAAEFSAVIFTSFHWEVISGISVPTPFYD